MFNADVNLMEKWAPVLNHDSAAPIQDNYRKAVTARLLENQEIALKQENAAKQGNFFTEAAQNVTGSGVDNFDPVLISLVRRAMPNLIAYDVAGVQPMNGPTGLIFAMKSKYATQAGDEALFGEADSDFSGTASTAGGGSSSLVGDVLSGETSADANTDTVDDVFGAGAGLTTAASEALGNSGGNFGEMAFSIEKATVEAKSRALKAEYTMELAQDLKAVHGLDAEGELANILSAEILAEINREVIRTINSKAKIGFSTDAVFDMAASADADGRWMIERFKALIMQIEKACNVIAKETRRGKGNFIICSSDVASAIAAAGMLDYTPALAANLNVDDTGNTFAGVLNGRTKVYVDPYSTRDYVTVGYRGSNPYDAGIFYCPYVPLSMVKAVGEEDFQPRIGFKTRYGMQQNPFVGSATGTGTNRANPYFRIFAVNNL
jgi:hypothetical protein|tara:strand:+ start:5348 stop:6655 length:1308 start_codon:yes stop_codon:yes gene_type:complete